MIDGRDCPTEIHQIIYEELEIIFPQFIYNSNRISRKVDTQLFILGYLREYYRKVFHLYVLSLTYDTLEDFNCVVYMFLKILKNT